MLVPYAVLLLLTACALPPALPLTEIPATATLQLTQTTPVPTLDRQLHVVPSDEPGVTPTYPPAECQNTAGLPAIQHQVTADMNYAQRALTVRQQIDYINRTNTSLSDLVLNVRPNTRPGTFDLHSLTINHTEAVRTLVGQRLTIQLPQPLGPGCTITLNLAFNLIVPPIEPENAYQGYLGYSPRQLNLGHWLPTLAARQQSEWVTHDLTPIGEQEVLDEAHWNVTFDIENAPATLRVAAPGVVEENGPTRWHFVLLAARDFSLSMSEYYNAASQRTENGVKVELYSFDDALVPGENGVVMDGAAFALATATRSLNMYEDLYGDYPYSRLIVVEADFPDGMEFSGIVFVGGEYFRSFAGSPASYLMMITAHEVSHQWWYARVGNDQALSPWLDEALATYSEYAFIEEYYPDLRNWWWDFRINRWLPEGFVDSTVYEFSSRRAYINAVYLRGVHMLRDLRDVLGTDAFFDWLRRYAEIGAGRVMTPDQFWSLLTPEQIEATAKIRAAYLRQPQIVYSVPQNPAP